MNNLIRTSQTFVNNGASVPAQGSTIASCTNGVLEVLGSLTNPQTQVAAAPTITTEPSLTLYSGYADGTTKKGMTIKGANITKYAGQRYSPDTRDVWSIGYNRKLAAGALTVANSTDYTFVISIKHDKNLYSERPLDFRLTFTSDVSATQQTICAQMLSMITANKAGLGKDVSAIIVGNGNSALAPTTFVYNTVTYTVFGGNGATLYGIEFTGKDIAQFQNTQYRIRRPYFAVFADTNTGFGTGTAVGQINAMTTGNGVYDSIYNAENFDYGFEGVLNRTMFPIPTLSYNAAKTYYTSAGIAGATVLTVVTLTDELVFLTPMSTIIPVGARIVVGVSSEVYEIKYWVSTTVAVVTVPIVTSEASTTVAMNFQYSIIDLEFVDTVVSSIGGVDRITKQIRIAVPAIDASSAYNSLSAAGTTLKTLFDAYCASSPASFAPIAI